MKDNTDRLVYDKGLAFFGKVTSGVSHELKNVLSIISEMGGLMSDLLSAAQTGKEISHEKFSKIAEGINRQVCRGDDLIKGLRHFSHNVDDFQATVPLDEAVNEIVALCQRMASLKEACLATEFQDGVSAQIDNVFIWQHAIYECICIALEGVHRGDVVTVRLGKREAKRRLEIVSPRELSQETIDQRMPLLLALMEEMGSTIEVSGDGETEEASVISISL